MKKKIIILTTGGTIAMRFDPLAQGLVPALSGADLMHAVPQLEEVCEIVDIIEVSNIPSPHMTPAIMLHLAKKADAILKDTSIVGLVITHGTDTIEESAYFLDLYLDTEKAVVFTGAMRSASDLGADGAANILAAAKVATCDKARGKGVMLVLNDTIHSARNVTKAHTANLSAFQSPCFGAIGYVDSDRVVFRYNPLNSLTIAPDKIEENVYLIKAFTGMEPDIFDFLIEKKTKGIVIEGFGCGNLPPMLISGIKKAVDAGIIVLLATRVLSGRVLDTYAYEAAVKPLKALNVITVGELSAPKARLKLMLLLGAGKKKQEIEEYFDRID